MPGWRPPGSGASPGPSTPAATTGTPGRRRGEVVSFASNDYLGLATHPAVVAAAHAALDRWGAGSGRPGW